MMKNVIRMMFLAVVVVSLVSAAMADNFGTGTNTLTINFVTISGSTNPTAEQTTAGELEGFGIVDNDYRMGVHEITNAQWNKFKAELAPVAVTGDPLDAYNEDPYFTGTNVPTNYVSWYEAAQMVNWLNTSTGNPAAYKFTGTQGEDENDSDPYTLAVWVSGDIGYDAGNPYRNSGAKYYMPTEDEWVKAAYWNGATIQTYATPDDTLPVEDVEANYEFESGDAPWDVGSGSEELNGTFDMMGNVMEWMESPYDPSYGVDSSRGLRGGSYRYGYGDLASSYRVDNPPSYGLYCIGFRVASEVPEPCSLGLLVLGGLALIKRRRG